MAKIKLTDVRIAFCQSLFEAEQYQGAGAFRHSATFLIDPNSENHKRVMAAIQEAAEGKFGKKANAQLESMRGNSNKYCYQKGDLKEWDGFQGMMSLASHRKQSDGRPLVIDQKKNPLTEKDGKPYGGCYVNATVDVYAQDGTNSGIRCGLIAVQFARDGDSFGGASKGSADDFESLEEGSDADDLA